MARNTVTVATNKAVSSCSGSGPTYTVNYSSEVTWQHDDSSPPAIPVQVGGGIRTESNVVTMMDIGVDRVILGTMAVENKEIVQSIVDRFGVESVIVGIDVRDDLVSIKGWKKSTFVSSSDLMDEMYRIGVRRFVYTDISRDGTLMEPNFQSIEQIVSRSDANIIASGGVSSLGHIKQLAGLGVEGVIIGKALYTGDINLNEAISIY